MRTELETPALLRRLRVALAGALSTVAVVLAAGCVSESSERAPSEAETPSPSSSEASPSPTADAAPAYCYQLSSLDMSRTFLIYSFVSAVIDETEGDPSTRLQLAQDLGGIAEEISYLTSIVPADLAAALLTIGEAVLATGERINAGDPISDAWDEMSGQKYQAADDLLDERLDWGECAGY